MYAARKRMEFLVITDDIGGQAAWSGDVENYPGYQFITGPELAAKFEEHMRMYNIPLREHEKVESIDKDGDIISVRTQQGSYLARTLLIASGKRTQDLNVPGEREFKNRGLTYCATCDGPLFAGKDVVVVGGGNSALDAVLQLIKIARHVHVVNISSALSGDAIMREKVQSSEMVTVHNACRITQITGEKFVTGVQFVRSGKEEEFLPVQGVFVEIGLIPNADFARNVQQNERGEIQVNTANETSVPGIFCRGRCDGCPGETDCYCRRRRFKGGVERVSLFSKKKFRKLTDVLFNKIPRIKTRFCPFARA